MLRGLIKGIAVTTLVAALAPQAGAEVSVRTDRSGAYVSTQILYNARVAPDRVWSSRGRGGRTGNVLNPAGDAIGDLWPTIAESPRAPFHPWVVWSRFDGADYDLAWARWTAQGWSAVSAMFDDGAAGDDLDADLAFSAEGRPYAVWWRDEVGGGRVYLSMFLNRGWSTPYPVSPAETDSSHPLLTIGDDGTMSVQYDTPEGAVSQLIVFDLPDTITDDINPQNCFFLKGNPHFVGQHRP